MRCSTTISAWVLSASLASNFVAVQGWSPVIPRELMSRQDQSFVPNTESLGEGDCGVFGQLQCGPLRSNGFLCFDPSRGDSCCEETWACGSGSFCFVDGRCCHNNESPADCARTFKIPLPSSFSISKTPAATPAATETSTLAKPISSVVPTFLATETSDVVEVIPSAVPTATATETSDVVEAVTSAVPTATTATIVTPPFPIPVRPTAASPAPSGTGIVGTLSGTGAPVASSTLTPFTGAASSLNIIGGVFGAVLGLAGVMAVV